MPSSLSRSLSRCVLAVAVLAAPTVPLAAADLIVDDPAPAGTSFPPPSPFTDQQFLYQHYVPKSDDPNQVALYYRLYVPPGYEPNGTARHPLVYFLHGDGEKQNPASQNQKQLLNNGQYAFVSAANQAVFPCFFVQVQTGTADRGIFSRTAVDLSAALAARYRIDSERLIVTGLSGGGGGAVAWAAAQPATWAGYVPLSPAMPGYSVANLATVPGWFFHAQNDTNQGPGNTLSAIATLRAAGARPIMTMYASGGHTGTTWTAAYRTPQLIPWLASLRRGQAKPQPVEVAITAPVATTTWNTTATTATVSGTTTDNQFGGTAAGLTAVKFAVGGYDVNYASQNRATSGTIAAWSTGSISLPAGATQVPVVATGASQSTALGGRCEYSDILLVSRTVSNLAPVANAGSDQTVRLPAAATLAGTVSDSDGPAPLTSAWSVVSGPGTVTFANAASSSTSATFSAAGTYVLRLGATDGLGASGSDDVAVTVSAANLPPVVDAGSDLAVTLPASATLAGTVSDSDGPAPLASAWSVVSGPGTAAFANTAAASTSATFSAAGTYVLRLGATDGLGAGASDDVVVTVAAAPQPTTVITYVDLGDSALQTAGNWNNLYFGSPTRMALADTIDSTGAATGVGIAASGFAWTNNQTVASSALYPANAQGDTIYVASGAAATVTLNGLDPDSTYDVTCFASRLWNANSQTDYTIGTTVLTLNAYNNSSTTVTFTGQAAPTGTLVLRVAAHAGASAGYIGVLQLTRHLPPHGSG